MLQVTYEAVDDLAPGRLAQVDEDRGSVLVRLDRLTPLRTALDQLNVEMAQFLARADWYQLWGDEIVSRHTPDRPLRVDFVLAPGCSHGVGIAEDRGVVTVYVAAGMTTDEFAAAMGPAVKDFLAKGRWFQLYAGEIISIEDHSAEPVSQV